MGLKLYSMQIPSPDSWSKRLILGLKLLAVIFTILIVWQSLTPSLNIQPEIPHLDKLQHLAVYGLLAGTMRLAWWRLWGGYILGFCLILGFGLEYLQGAMDLGRTASIADGVANVIGAIIFLIIIPRFWKRET